MRNHAIKLQYLSVFAVIFLSLSACVAVLPELHKIEVKQGNILDAEDIAKLEPGLNQDQVRYLLGSPVVRHAFHGKRWDYLYYESEAGASAKPRRITLEFVDGLVVSIDDQYISDQEADVLMN